MSAVTVYDGNFSFQTTSSIKLRGWPMPRVKQMANHIAQRWMQMVRLWHIKQMEPHMHSATSCSICGNFLEILMIFSYFMHKKSSFWPFLWQIFTKLEVCVAKILKIWRKFNNQYLFLSAANWPSCSTVTCKMWKFKNSRSFSKNFPGFLQS